MKQHRRVARIVFDEFHSESWSVSRARALEIQPEAPENSSYAHAAMLLEQREFVVERNIDTALTAEVLKGASALVLLHPCESRWESTTSNNSPRLNADEISAIRDFVAAGGGLFVVSEYENDKYGNNINELLHSFGISVENSTVTDTVYGVNEEKTHVRVAPQEGDPWRLLTGVSAACFYRSGSCKVVGNARAVLCASATARPASAVLVAASTYDAGRVAFVGDSDIFGDEYIERFDHQRLWLNICYWISEPAFECPNIGRGEPPSDATPAGWRALKEAVNSLRTAHRQVRQADGTYHIESGSHADLERPVDDITGAISELRGCFAHDATYLDALISDFAQWKLHGLGKPDFSRSLEAFNPQVCRRENIEHVVLFPMYTPNNSLDVYFEALLVRVPWYDWLADIERNEFRNDKFVPGHLVDFTEGYNSECAVMFPETVSINGIGTNQFGIIFCDREADRCRRYFKTCAAIVQLNTPPELACFFESAELVRDMFAAWDLVHDASHSLGPLPFDPFMIRQLAPYWMYALEELRVDLRSVRAGLRMSESDFPFARTIGFGVLFDRIFRFAIVGSRVKNYDGLAGQVLFAALHQKKAIKWENNQLTIHWDGVFPAMQALSDELETIYDRGADQSRVRRFIEAHSFISRYVPPNINSKWQHPSQLAIPEDDVKRWLAHVLPDEFPLGSFHVQLKKKVESAFRKAAGS